MSRILALVAACGWLTALSLAQPCGTYWSDQFSFEGLDAAIRTLVVFDPDADGPEPPAIYAGGQFVSHSGEQWLNYIARWTGTGWAPVGDGFDGPVYALAVFDDDGPGPNPPALYAGGSFTLADGTPASGIAKWDGTVWSTVGGGVSAGGRVYALAVYDDGGAGPNLPALYAGGWFTTAGSISASNIAEWDGTTWSALGSGTNSYVYALAVFDRDGAGPQPTALVAGGAFTLAGGVSAGCVAQWNGNAWSGLDTGTNGGVDALGVFDADGDGPSLPVLVAGGWFTKAGGSSANRVACWNGTSWAALASGTDDRVRALSTFDPDGSGPLNPLLIAGGEFTTAGGTSASRIAQWNGSSWSALASGADDIVYALVTFDPDGDGPGTPALLAGGAYATMGGMPADRLAAWNGAAWAPFGPYSSGGVNGVVLSLTTFDDDGDGPHTPALYAGGQFVRAAGVQVDGIARWDGTAWSAVGGGVSTGGRVAALAVYDDDGAGPNLPALYAGGWFTTAGGVPTGCVAQWDGTAWSALGTGIPGWYVEALTSFDADGPGPNLPVLVAGGTFWSAGGVLVHHVAQWNGSSWSALGTGFGDETLNPVVVALAVYDSDADGPLPSQLYAGGFFTSSGGVPVHGIARWDGNTWCDMGGVTGGMYPGVFAFAVFDDDGAGPNLPALYVGGWFTTAGGVAANYIAKWDGTSWSALGEGVNDEVWDLVVFDDDGPGPRPPALYVGGYFTTAGGLPANSLARWDGSSWEPVGGGVSGASEAWGRGIEALAAFDDDGPGPHLPTLFVGGTFTIAGSQPSENIAAWTPLSVPIGDMNCDGLVDFADINPFVLYLSNLATWRATFPDCPTIVGDINCDGTYGQASFGDINPFVDLLTGK
jgi:hypothetical protein